uniref:KRAB domain-containing protein n=1 Tax=Molossus molossus TaxID=27622 RepID=A0A7J8I901_MOLMO|nr:hypothetical protein HJG59_010505 [Molossus molossus]
MLENDDHLVSAGHCITKPEAICKLEQEEGSWPLEGGFPGWSGPAQSMERASEQWRPRKDEQTQSPSLPTTRSRSVQGEPGTSCVKNQASTQRLMGCARGHSSWLTGSRWPGVREPDGRTEGL